MFLMRNKTKQQLIAMIFEKENKAIENAQSARDEQNKYFEACKLANHEREMREKAERRYTALQNQFTSAVGTIRDVFACGAPEVVLWEQGHHSDENQRCYENAIQAAKTTESRLMIVLLRKLEGW